MSRLVGSLSGTNLGNSKQKRHKFLPLVVLSHILQERKQTISQSIVDALKLSPLVQAERARKWWRTPGNASYLGDVYEAIDRSPEIVTSDGVSTVQLDREGMTFNYNYPIRVSAELEWLWFDSWLRPRQDFVWREGYDFARFQTERAASNLSSFYPRVGPAVWTYWAKTYWDATTPADPFSREKSWYATYDSATGTITLTSDGNWTRSFNPGIDMNAQYLYTGWDLGFYPYKVGGTDTILNQIVDACTATPEPDYGTYPFIPVRLNNEAVNKSGPEISAQAKKLFKKATGSKLTKLLETLEDNPNVREIDLGMIMFGIEANNTKAYAKRYIYQYFQGLRTRAGNPSGAFTLKLASNVPYPGGWASNAGYAVTFKGLSETTGTGLRIPGSEVGSLVWEVVGEVAKLHWQVTADEWRTMSIDCAIARWMGLPGDSVIKLWEVVLTTTDTGFLIPFHAPTLKAMRKTDGIEVAQEGLNLIVGTYTLIDTSSITAGIIFFIAGVLLVAFPPGAPGAIGLLGANAAVGAAIGLAGTAAAVAGAVINAVAAIIVMKLIQKGAMLVFGEKIGAIIGAVVGFVAVTVGTGLMNGQSISQIWGTMGSAQNLLALTNAVGSGISGYISASIADLQAEMQEYSDRYTQKMSELDAAYAKEFAYGNRVIDPMSLTGTQSGNFLETPSQFLSRTLLTGTDIADISTSMISSFTDLTLTSELPGTT